MNFPVFENLIFSSSWKLVFVLPGDHGFILLNDRLDSLLYLVNMEVLVFEYSFFFFPSICSRIKTQEHGPYFVENLILVRLKYLVFYGFVNVVFGSIKG